MSATRKILLPATGCALLLALALTLLAPHQSRPGQARAASTQSAAVPAATGTGAGPTTEQPIAPPATETSGSPSPANAQSAPATPAAPATPQPMPSGAAAAADGPAADPLIEAQFQKDHPGDLPAADAAQVRTVARDVWLAETTGTGRDRWPSYFPPPATPLRPYTQVRVQAMSAHTSGDQVIVALLWAGADPSGDYQDRRPAVLALIRTPSGWEPTR